MLEIDDLKRQLAFQSRLENLIYEDDAKKSELPKKIGIAYPTFAKTVNHGIIPKTKILIKIADYFDVSLEYLLNKTDDNDFIASTQKKTLYEHNPRKAASRSIRLFF